MTEVRAGSVLVVRISAHGQICIGVNMRTAAFAAKRTSGNVGNWPEAALPAVARNTGLTSEFLSLPLNRRRWFSRNVVDDAVESAHFVDDAIGDFA